jgi:membrane protein DedA with SNARE-associated domain
MDEQVLHSLQWIESMPSWVMFAFFFFSAFMENVFPPYPGDTILAFSGFLAARGVMSLPIVFFAGFAGSVAGAFVMYMLGHRALELARRMERSVSRPAWLKNSLHEAVSQESIEKTGLWFNRYGLYFVIVSRFSAGLRFFVSIVAGISRVSLPLYMLCFALGVVLWNGLLTAGGYTLGRNWELVLVYLKLYNTVFIIVAVVAVAGFVFWKWRSSNIH